MRLTEAAGFREMDAALRSLPRSTARGVARRAMKKALAPVEAAAREAAPTPGLADSVGISSRLTKSQSKGNPNRYTMTLLDLFVGSDSPVAHLFEFGTGPRHHKSGQFTGDMAPRPFMRPAWDGNTEKVLELLSSELRVEIEKALARAARKAARAAR